MSEGVLTDILKAMLLFHYEHVKNGFVLRDYGHSTVLLAREETFSMCFSHDSLQLNPTANVVSNASCLACEARVLSDGCIVWREQ